jgi:thymidylate synthase
VSDRRERRLVIILWGDEVESKKVCQEPCDLGIEFVVAHVELMQESAGDLVSIVILLK